MGGETRCRVQAPAPEREARSSADRTEPRRDGPQTAGHTSPAEGRRRGIWTPPHASASAEGAHEKVPTMAKSSPPASLQCRRTGGSTSRAAARHVACEISGSSHASERRISSWPCFATRSLREGSCHRPRAPKVRSGQVHFSTHTRWWGKGQALPRGVTSGRQEPHGIQSAKARCAWVSGVCVRVCVCSPLRQPCRRRR